MWLQILARVPNAILWLLRFPAAGEPHLLRTANEWAGPSVASRVIFTDVAPKQVHIHRGRIADLFLDTPECNAHTTAADILWSGTPILTFPKYGHKMCSRVGASIAYSTGYGNEMVVSTEEEYEERAIAFAQGCRWEYVEDSVLKQSLGLPVPPQAMSTSSIPRPFNPINGGVKQQQHLAFPGQAGHQSVVHWIGHGPLMDLRKKLWENRDRSLLFDTLRWTRNLEKGLAEAWRRWESGQEFDELMEPSFKTTEGRRRSSAGMASQAQQYRRSALNGNIIVKNEGERPLVNGRTHDPLGGSLTHEDFVATSGQSGLSKLATDMMSSTIGNGFASVANGQAYVHSSSEGPPTHPLSLAPQVLGETSSLTASLESQPRNKGMDAPTNMNGIPEGRVELGVQSEPRRGSRGRVNGAQVEKLEQQIKRPDVGCIFVCD